MAPQLPGVRGLGEYLREQRESAQLSVRQLSAAAGISNPYLSQIERGLKKPSAEILQALASGLRISAESLYVRAGLLEEPVGGPLPGPDARTALMSDRRLSDRQRRIMIDLYDSFVTGADPADASDSR
ncbi:MAG: helix-turn-helix transcriptional regulator [Austwickia sp.]|nr:helix-turn-helix transcriptional regulator [Austwickia sp.]MBK8436376.1 helix-turn-helix transcriptional regulator [Austwickia sp.]MBK9102052.1 helix-turn-helix transcriptional regulator [Austwickia sp.]